MLYFIESLNLYFMPKKEEQLCDRCGNDFTKGQWSFWFPHKKVRILVCHICLLGLAYGFYRDIKSDIAHIHGGVLGELVKNE